MNGTYLSKVQVDGHLLVVVGYGGEGAALPPVVLVLVHRVADLVLIRLARVAELSVNVLARVAAVRVVKTCRGGF